MAYGSVNVDNNKPNIKVIKESELDSAPSNTLLFMIMEDKK